MRYREIIYEDSTAIPAVLAPLAKAIKGKSFESAKRLVAAKIGSVRPRERFDDETADVIFLRLQRTAQIGQFTSEQELRASGRKAQRLTGDGLITVYRSCPPGTGIRPGDFCAAGAHEAGFYKHGGNRIQKARLPRSDLIQVTGSTGGQQEYVYLPQDYRPPEPQVFFDSFRRFYDVVNATLIG